MLLSDDQRKLLGAFLRSHRERLRAPDTGLGPRRAERRRTPGLRREEVALICGMSPTWYSWIEQGRDISVSPSALARLAAALQLTAAERAYLFELAQARDPAAPDGDPAGPQDAAQALHPLVAAITAPAYVLDRLWRACAWNAPAAELFSDWLQGTAPCLLDYVYLDPGARRLIPDWENRARRLAAELRADTGRQPEDPDLKALIDRLSAQSPDFAAFWSNHAVLAREGGTRRFDHPGRGPVHYTQATLVPAGWPTHKLVVLLG